MTKYKIMFLPFLFACTPFVLGQEQSESFDQPRSTPLTRPALKMALEEIKERAPRIPLPPLTETERELLGERADDYEHRVKFHFLGQDRVEPRRSRQEDPEMSLSYAFKTQLFWIVSRVNNCQYCIGHQETKLLAAGITEDDIARLDCEWSMFPIAQQNAFEFARQLTSDPASISDESFQTLRAHFTDKQILEMTLSIAWNNSINRWKEALAVPQNPEEGGNSRLIRESIESAKVLSADLPHGSYLTPTSARYERVQSSTVFSAEPSSNEATHAVTCRNAARKPKASIEDTMIRARERKPRLPLASETLTRKVFDGLIDDSQPVPIWMRVLAIFPVEGRRRGEAILKSDNSDALSPEMRARLTWVVAREDDAAYLLGLAANALRELGLLESEQSRLESDWSDYEPKERILLQLARDLSHSPVVLTDATVAEAVALAGPAAVVQTISHVVNQSALVRLSEAAQLPHISN
jgi:AhpD family alkylhydroperoxidase